MVLCHPRWLPTSGLTEFAVCWGGAGFEPRTTDLQSGALPLSHLSSLKMDAYCVQDFHAENSVRPGKRRVGKYGWAKKDSKSWTGQCKTGW
jgi:hypothetical protein